MVPCIFRSGRRVPLIYLSLSWFSQFWLGSRFVRGTWRHCCRPICGVRHCQYLISQQLRLHIFVWRPCIAALWLSGPARPGRDSLCPLKRLTGWPCYSRLHSSVICGERRHHFLPLFLCIALILLVLCVLAWFQVQIILSILLLFALCVTFSSPPRLVEDEWAGQQEGEEEEEKEEERRRKKRIWSKNGKGLKMPFDIEMVSRCFPLDWQSHRCVHGHSPSAGTYGGGTLPQPPSRPLFGQQRTRQQIVAGYYHHTLHHRHHPVGLALGLSRGWPMMSKRKTKTLFP